MFDLRQLQLFIAVAEFGSFSRAAVALSVSQPVLSRQIKSLEESVGIALLYRNGRGIVLTEAGKLLQSYATAILEQASRAKSELGALRSNPRGAIVLGMPPSVGVVLTAPLVQHFREQFPQVSMRVVEGFSGHLLEWLVMGKIDVAVLYNAPRMNNLLAEPILRDELFLLGAKNDPCNLGSSPVDAAVVSKIPMILPARPHGLRCCWTTSSVPSASSPGSKSRSRRCLRHCASWRQEWATRSCLIRAATIWWRRAGSVTGASRIRP